MKIFNIIMLLLSLSCTVLSPTDTQPTELIPCFNEYTDYLGKLLEASQRFEKAYNDEPRLQCKSCKTKKLAYGEIIGWLIGYSAQALTDIHKFNIAKKHLIETIEGLSKNTPTDLSNFMLQTANDLQVGCSHCQEKCWELIASTTGGMIRSLKQKNIPWKNLR